MKVKRWYNDGKGDSVDGNDNDKQVVGQALDYYWLLNIITQLQRQVWTKAMRYCYGTGTIDRKLSLIRFPKFTTVLGFSAGWPKVAEEEEEKVNQAMNEREQVRSNKDASKRRD